MIVHEADVVGVGGVGAGRFEQADEEQAFFVDPELRGFGVAFFCTA